jgi:hypothetical protein
MQHPFEEDLRQQAVQQREIAAEHGLSEAEAAMIRLHMLDGETMLGQRYLALTFWMFAETTTKHSTICLGVVSPTDATLHHQNLENNWWTLEPETLLAWLSSSLLWLERSRAVQWLVMPSALSSSKW